MACQHKIGISDNVPFMLSARATYYIARRTHATSWHSHAFEEPSHTRRLLESQQSSFRWQTCEMSLSSFYMDLDAVDSASSHVRAHGKQCSITAEVEWCSTYWSDQAQRSPRRTSASCRPTSNHRVPSSRSQSSNGLRLESSCLNYAQSTGWP